MRLSLLSLVGPVFATAPVLISAATAQTTPGERIPATAVSPLVLETMEQVAARERTLPKDTKVHGVWQGEDGRWFVPSSSARTPVHSGLMAIVNEWGDPRMGIGFGHATDVAEVWAAGHGGAPARAVRFVGFRNGQAVVHSAWITLTSSHQRVTLGFDAIDRLEVQASPFTERTGYIALDDLVFAAAGEPGATRVLDFEDLSFKHMLSGTNYAGLTWETGTGFKTTLEKADIVPAPQAPATHHEVVDDSWTTPMGLDPTTPNVWDDFIGTTQGDPGANLIPPDTCGCNGPDHYLAITNSNLSAWRKSDRVRTVNTSLTAFFPGASGTVGDPRAVYDVHAQRYVVLATNFSGSATIYIGVSQTTDPAGAWFKFSFVTAQGTDAGKWPDYPTLGVDSRGIYTAAYMVGAGNLMTIFAIDKAPLITNPPSLGVITAFRSLAYGGAIQPCTTYGTPAGEFLISGNSSTSFRLRRVNPPLTAPTLTDLGTVTVPAHATAPTAPALGSTTNINTIDTRPMNAVYRNGSIYTAHNISVNGRAGCRWYQIGTSPVALLQSGTLGDPVWHYYFASIAVDAQNNIGLGFSGSNAGVYCSTFISGRRASDPAGLTSPPALVKAGEASWNRNDGSGRNRFGDYSHIDVDAVDQLGFWTNQEYIFQTNIWRTRVTRFGFEASLYGDGLAGTTGVPSLRVTARPRIGTTVTFAIGNSRGANTGGALVIGSSATAIPFLGGTVLANPTFVQTISVPAAGVNIGLPFSNDIALVGNPVFFQTAIVDSGAPQGIAFSRGLEVRPDSR